MTELENAINVLIKALAEDKSEGSYYFGWQANIAITMLDEFVESGLLRPGSKIYSYYHSACNEAAKKFLNRLINTEPKNQMAINQ